MSRRCRGLYGVWVALFCIAYPGYILAIDRTILGERSTALVYNQAGEARELSEVGDHKRTLIVFWSRHNRFAQLELKYLCDSKSRLNDIRVIAVNVDHFRPTDVDKDSATSYLRELGCDFDSYFDPDLTAFGQLGVTAVPSTFLIDSAGRIVWTLAGYLVSNRQTLTDQITSRTTPPLETWRSRINSKAIRYYQLARQLQSRRQWRLAETNCSIAAGLDTTFAEPMVLLAELNAFAGRRLVGDSLLQRALEIDSACVPALVLTAKLAFLENDATRTREWISRALAVEPGLPVANALMAWVSAIENRHSEVEEFWSKAATTGAHDPFVLYVCARSEELLGNIERSAKLYRQALDLLNATDE